MLIIYLSVELVQLNILITNNYNLYLFQIRVKFYLLVHTLLKPDANITS